MALAQVNAGDRINASDLNQFYNILKGVAASGESITLIYNAAGVVIVQPSSDPAAGTEAIQIKNNAGTVQGAISFNGKFYAADGVVATPGIAFESDNTTGIYKSAASTISFATASTLRASISSAGITIVTGGLIIGSALTKQVVSRYIFSGTLNVSNSTGGTYADFGGSFTTTVTTLAGDQVIIRVQTLLGKLTGGYAALVVDRGGTKLPANAPGSCYTYGPTGGGATPVMFEYVDTPGAGTFTYKPQVYASDSTGASKAGDGGSYCQMTVEVSR